MDPAGIFRIITNSTLLATRLLPAGRPSPLLFPSPRLCVTVAEDMPPGTVLSTVTTAYTHGEEVKYSISAGNTKELFNIDQRSGTVTLAGALDHEMCDKHELVVTAEGRGRAARTVLVVRVDDVNDNPPAFLVPDQRLTIVEEDDRDLPAIIAKVEAVDADELDAGRLVFRVSGDGAGQEPGGEEAAFTINAHTGDLIQLKALDRDPPQGRSVWRLRVEVRDGQRWGEGKATPTPLHPISPTYLHRQASWGHHEPGSDPSVAEGTGSGGHKNKKTNYHMKESSSLGHKTTAPRSGLQFKHGHDVIQESQSPIKILGRSFRLPRHFRSKFGVQFHCRDAAECASEYKNADSNSEQSRNAVTERLNGRWNTAPHGLQMGHLRVLNEPHLFPIFPSEPHTTDQHLKKRRHHRREERERLLGGSDGTLEISKSVGHKRHKKVRKIRPRRRPDTINLPPRVVGLSTRGKEVAAGNSVKKTYNTTWRVASSTSREPDPLQSCSRRGGVWSTPPCANQSTNSRDQHEDEEVDFFLSQNIMDNSEPHGMSSGDDHPALNRGRRATRDSSGMSVRRVADASAEDRECNKFVLREDSASSKGGEEHWGRRVHVTETTVTVLVKDINDNAPVFPSALMLGHVRENAAEGAAVVVVKAWDADDAADGSNARLTYAIEKNVVDEASGAALFSVEPHSGQVRTTRCCLDREATPEYRLQVVAADGGGLKGTGTVVVLVVDENDNPPRLARRRWELEVEETPPAVPPPNATLLELTAADKDTDTSLLFRVEPRSGPGWDKFEVRSTGSAGQLFASRSLDYEQKAHRRGFRFRVQVTDQAPGGWGNLAHVDSAWVTVRLKDVNDNPPLFSRPHAHVTVSEDADPGTVLASMPARDPDAGGRRGVDYRLQGGWGSFAVDATGNISLRRRLDRESPRGAAGVVLVVAVDHGSPPLTTTATLTVTVIDVNDCPPSIMPPTVLHVTEGGPPTRLGVLNATDPDEWALGHGPPFSFSLASTNSAYVFSLVRLKFDPLLFNGRGGAELWTAGAVDREQYHRLNVAVKVSDAQGLAATHYIVVLVDDLNDNPMRPGAKTVYLWKTQGGGSDAPLGRVFVEDPDDWDLGDKEFEWAGSPHPLFSLHPRDGTIFASSQVREGRYELQFSVSDRVWRQQGVAANVTVVVHTLLPEALTHAVPLALTPTTPTDLTRGWSPSKGGGGLGALVKEILKVVGEPKGSVEVVSVYECGGPSPARQPAPSTPPDTPTDTTTSCVWVSVREADGSFVNSIKLRGLLTLHTSQLEAATRLSVMVTSDPGGPASPRWAPYLETPHSGSTAEGDPRLGAASFMASTSLPLQVVDTNATSLVTPRLTRPRSCNTHTREPETCTPTSCLNGGRCVRNMRGENRCVCSGRAWGPQCRLLSRTFRGSGWTWLKPLPPCLPVTLSFRLLVRHPHGLLLYAGPLAPTPRHATPAPMLALQLVDGRPQALLEGEGGPIKLQVNTSLHDGRWHSLHLAVDHQGAALMVDMCGRGWERRTRDDAHCLARGRWKTPKRGRVWLESAFLQVGGQAQTLSPPEDYGWRETPIRHRLTGCLSRLTVNTQVVDLGDPVHSHASVGGCHEQDEACSGGCGLRGQCVGGLRRPRCECDPGWTGPSCATSTVPVRLGVASYLKVALSFSPEPWVLRAQVRVRLRGAHSGMLLQLAAHHHAAALTLQLQAGIACASVSGAGWKARQACVLQRPLGDGVWHTVTAERWGHSLVVRVDDGDDWRCNETVVGMTSLTSAAAPKPLRVDKHEGVTVGGLPEFTGVELMAVHNDLQDTCIDDLRVSGRSLPLSSTVNTTKWGQVTTMGQVAHGCSPPVAACDNSSCAAPLFCRATWEQPSCSCGLGARLVGGSCEDVDECQWRPCLHDGVCHNLQPGYLCVCGANHLGDHCQWPVSPPEGHPLAGAAAITGLTISLIVLVFVAVIMFLRLHRFLMTRRSQEVKKKGSTEHLKGVTVGGVKATATLISEEDSGGKVKELLRLKVLDDPTDNQYKGSAVAGGGSGVTSTVSMAEVQRLSLLLEAAESMPEDKLRDYVNEGNKFTTTRSLASTLAGEPPPAVPPAASSSVKSPSLPGHLPSGSSWPPLAPPHDAAAHPGREERQSVL